MTVRTDATGTNHSNQFIRFKHKPLKPVFAPKMCINLLKNILVETITIDELIHWLRNDNVNDTLFDKFIPFECSQEEFILYFLNYIHDETSRFNNKYSNQATPSKIVPKNLELSAPDNDKNPKIRLELFPELKKIRNEKSRDSRTTNHSTPEKSFNRTASTPKTNKSYLETSLNDSDIFNKNALLMSPISPLYSKNPQNLSKNRGNAPKSSTSKSTSLCLGDFIVQKRSAKKKLNKSFTASNDKEEISNNDKSKLAEITEKQEIENCKNVSNKKINLLQTKFSNVKISSEIDANAGTNKISTVSTRRINPTSISVNKSAFSCSENSFTFQKDESENFTESHSDQRNILNEERLKVASRRNESTVITPRIIKTSVHVVQPSIDSVTFKKELDIFIEIYCTLLNLNLVINCMTEYYFLFSLLLAQSEYIENVEPIEELKMKLKANLTNLQNEIDNVDKDNYFKTIHNCVYFASIALLKQSHILMLLDRATLKMLCENQRLMQFAPPLIESLNAVYNEKVDKKVSVDFTIDERTNVSFISDTDNRENFPSDIAFQAFRKQRDLFYDILRMWDTNHMKNSWNITLALGGKIRTLLNINCEPVNYMHFTRLFKAQLLSTCQKNKKQDDSVSENYLSFLNSLPNMNADKLSKLKDRLVTRQNSSGFNLQPSFPGQQEFYKDFILIANSPIFNKHLSDSFINEIIHLDDTVFCSSEVEDVDDSVDTSTRKVYILSIKSLRILAKFLGFIDSLPYKTDIAPTTKILSSQISLRQDILPSFDLRPRLLLAIKNKKLILIIPWVVKYLALMDYTSLRLPYYKSLLEILFNIYHHLSLSTASVNNNFNLIKFCLGWLFEQANFPQDLYYTWLANKYRSVLSPNEYLDCSLGSLEVNESVENKLHSDKKLNDEFYLDDSDIVDEAILYICCPYLSDLKYMLNSDPNSRNNRAATIRYIRPNSTKSTSNELSSKRLELQLEEAFFHGQPTSIRKTVEFVSERVASICVKNICNVIVPDVKIAAREELANYALQNDVNEENIIDKNTKELFMKKAMELSEQYYESLKTAIKEKSDILCKERCDNSVKSLLSNDVHPVTINTCIAITLRMCKERRNQWIDSHVTSGIFLKEFDSLMDGIKNGTVHKQKKTSHSLPAGGRNIEHSSEALSPVVLLDCIREIMWNVIEKSSDVTKEEIISMLDKSESTCTARCDLNPSAQSEICRLFVDLALLLATHTPDILTDEPVLNKLMHFWKTYASKDQHSELFVRILCPRNAEIFERSKSPPKAWAACSAFLIHLLKENLLTNDLFEEQALSMLRQDWSPPTLQLYTECLKTVVEERKKCGYSDKFAFLLTWISDYCNDDEFFY